MLRIGYLLVAGLVLCLGAGAFVAVSPSTAGVSAYGAVVAAD